MSSIWNAISAPQSGDLLAIRSGSPAETLTLGGIIRRAEPPILDNPIRRRSVHRRAEAEP